MKKVLFAAALALASAPAVADVCDNYALFAYQVMKGRMEGVSRQTFDTEIRLTTVDDSWDNILRRTTVEAAYSSDSPTPNSYAEKREILAIFSIAIRDFCRDDLAKSDR